MNQQIEIMTPGQDIVPMDLVQRAIVQGADVVVLDKLMELQERWERNKAQKAYSGAIADAKAEFGPIKKSQQVDFTTKFGRTRYKHEDMADIADAIDKPLSKHGLSYRWHTDSDIKNGSVTVTCIVSHRDGYSVENSLTGAFDVSGGKNPIQSLGSACTYLERYTLKAALGLVPDEDDDAQSVQAANRGLGSMEGQEPPPAGAPREQTFRQQPRQEPPPPREEPYSVEPPADIRSNDAWAAWARDYAPMVRKSQSVEEFDKWTDVNRDLLVQFQDLEPALYKQMSDWIIARRTELLRRTPG